MAEPWWKTCVAYQIYPRSFCDTGAGSGGAGSGGAGSGGAGSGGAGSGGAGSGGAGSGGAGSGGAGSGGSGAGSAGGAGDGVGDLAGVRRHLDHLAWLGVDALWLSPFYPSPMFDYGYDVADFCGVDPMFGDLATFDALVADAHRLGIKIIIDWVPNHTSIEHPWFAEARSSKDDPRRDWYVWRDPAPDGGPPNNWIESLTMGSAWTLDDTTGQYYLHCFLPEQPDLNWANDEVVDAMGDTLRFWLDRGVDGFRMDVVHLIGKDPALPDEPPELVGLPHVVLNDRPETHDHLRGIRKLLDGYPGDRVSVGEVYLLDTDLVAQHYGDGDELHLCFNFPPLYAAWDADTWRQQIERTAAAHDPRGAWPTWVLSNHDNPRHRSRYGGSEARARAAAVLLLTLRGTPFLYAGEELGLLDAEVPEDRRHDPGGRDGCRAPIPWDGTPNHGWAGGEPWLPWPPEATERSVAVLRDDPTSILHLYRRLIHLRRRTPALVGGSLHLLDGRRGVLAYRRSSAGGQHVTVAVNFTSAPVQISLSGEVLLSTTRPGGATFTGTLEADEAVIVG